MFKRAYFLPEEILMWDTAILGANFICVALIFCGTGKQVLPFPHQQNSTSERWKKHDKIVGSF